MVWILLEQATAETAFSEEEDGEDKLMVLTVSPILAGAVAEVITATSQDLPEAPAS